MCGIFPGSGGPGGVAGLVEGAVQARGQGGCLGHQAAGVAEGPGGVVQVALLQGVLAGTASGGGAALIAIDNQPARPFRLGATVTDGLVVKSLGRRQVRLGPSEGTEGAVTLEVPEKGG